MVHKPISFFNIRVDDPIEDAYADRFHTHLLTKKKISEKHTTWIENIKEVISQFKNDDSNYGLSLLKHTLTGAFVGLFLSPSFIALESEQAWSPTRHWKENHMRTQNGIKTLRLGLRSTRKYIFYGAGIAALYNLLYINAFSSTTWTYEMLKVSVGHALFGGVLGLILSPHKFFRYFLGGYLVGYVLYFIAGSSYPQKGYVYLPTNDPVILEARKKNLERENIHALSLAIINQKLKKEDMNSKFD